MIPTCNFELSWSLAAKFSERAIWCSASTRRDMRETSMRRIKASSSSDGINGDPKDSPRYKLGITVELRGIVMKTAADESIHETDCSLRMLARK